MWYPQAIIFLMGVCSAGIIPRQLGLGLACTNTETPGCCVSLQPGRACGDGCTNGEFFWCIRGETLLT